ncbi:flagellar motor control protein ZomB [Jongsikchunia kroppenstedtii]|uniref:flagellar motor control protein ZomB n=1 Tax=Jongsikchunia kroppenstedtii TaxID=1121721 RepID=UPI00036080AE|nr:flagellar motor control protein ZomB [Jongsikchunia kroppenstedtii]
MPGPAAASFSISALVVAIMFAIGGWQRRWIADDGLIVLRTVRNLLAGNGPVFNKGERVEANTSTAWTYLIWFWSWVTQGQTEYVVLWLALTLSVTALPIAMYGTYRLLNRGRNFNPGWTLVLPLGAVIYIALPPARDFATSGLEVSLCLFWIAVLWCQLVAWSQRDRTVRSGLGYWTAMLALAFNAGLSPLIRPELTIFGGLVLLMVFCTEMSWRMRVAFVAVAAALPVGYEIFRMGYYGLLVPNTAIAKDANGAKWSEGFRYLANMFGPYVLLLPLILAVIAAAVVWRGWGTRKSDAAPAAGESLPSVDWRARLQNFREWLQSPPAVVTLVLLCGLIEALYWLRQGGDFMHARVLLAPLFILLLPVMVIPIAVPQEQEQRRKVVGWAGGAAMGVIWIATMIWALVTAQSPGLHNGDEIGRAGIVDERRFYIANLANPHPITAADYANYGRMPEMIEDIDQYKDHGGVLLPGPDFDHWFYAPPSPNAAHKELTVYFLNLGMTSMNAPLDVRVVDQMGLAYPLAAHSQRLTDGRIGHDKDMAPEWVVAESQVDPTKMPGYLRPDWYVWARDSLRCTKTQQLLASYQGPMNLTKFRHNLRQAYEFTKYRIDRDPQYEVLRCKPPGAS